MHTRTQACTHAHTHIRTHTRAHGDAGGHSHRKSEACNSTLNRGKGGLVVLERARQGMEGQEEGMEEGRREECGTGEGGRT